METLIPALGLLVMISLPIIFRILSHPKSTVPEYRQHKRVTVVRFRCPDCGQDPVDVPIENTVVSFQDMVVTGEYQVLAACKSCGAALAAGPYTAAETAGLVDEGSRQEWPTLAAFRSELATEDPVEACRAGLSNP